VRLSETGRGRKGEGRSSRKGRLEGMHDPIGTCHSEDSVSFFFSSLLFSSSSSHQMTPLHRAALKNMIEAVAALISHGADVNAREMDGETPLMLASYNGRAKVVEALLDAGTDKELKAAKGRWEGKTALDLARSRNKVDVVAILERR
jgi:hypothetical protein